MGVFADLLDTKKTLLVDGAMGTELFARGLTAGDPPEMWNIDMPDKVTSVHTGYIDAGSDIILTNSFGGTSFRLKLHNLAERAVELNAAAARVARAAADKADRTVVVAGSMGPSGELMAPLGEMTPGTARTAFAEQAKGLAEGGADVLWIETMSSLDEVAAAVEGARIVTDLPIAATMSFDTAGRTMMGVTGAEAATRMIDLGLVAIGANCGNNIAETESAVAEIRSGAGDVPVIVKANAGVPEFKGESLTYTGTPEVMGAHVKRMMDLGVTIIGGCCGTSTEHLAYMRGVVDGDIAAPDVDAPGPKVVAAGAGRDRTRRRSRRRG
ncbi:MAG: betaine--homocysteine S-methyltransferase [Acidimicrobiales bacterium]|nr:betaine--homocysteine S-methyltransferase [Acidimicrobiia bacterium]NNC81862.1 betaine--homocysteine S-methyltransferase [Acidimicrobiales bacterium]RZV48861.1 MAG: betaine--homocysteine S-methyltransferase [Acidimicrobiales bacterium]